MREVCKPPLMATVCLLGALTGTHQFCETYTEGAVVSWKHQLQTSASVAHIQPPTAYARIYPWFRQQVDPPCKNSNHIGALFKSSGNTIRGRLTPLLTGQPAPGDSVRELLALPLKFGLELIYPATALAHKLERCVQAKLTDRIRHQTSSLGDVCLSPACSQSCFCFFLSATKFY